MALVRAPDLHAALAARLGAAHGLTLEDLGLGVSPDQRIAHGIARAASEVLGMTPREMRPALAAALGKAREAGLTVEALHTPFAAPLRAKSGKKTG